MENRLRVESSGPQLALGHVGHLVRFRQLCPALRVRVHVAELIAELGLRHGPVVGVEAGKRRSTGRGHLRVK